MSQIADIPANERYTVTTEKRLIAVQAIAGSLFAVFVMLHLSNIAIAPFGIDVFNEYQRTIRKFYQYPLIELLIVIGPLLTHAIAGIWLFSIRRGRRHKRPFLSRLHSWAGCLLLVFIVGHILAVRGASFFYDVFPEFEGLAFSLWYFPAYFYPYYFLLALAGFYHATNGLRTLGARKGLKLTATIQATMTTVAGLWIMVSLLALGGILFNIGDPTDNDFARLGASLLNMDPDKPWK